MFFSTLRVGSLKTHTQNKAPDQTEACTIPVVLIYSDNLKGWAVMDYIRLVSQQGLGRTSCLLSWHGPQSKPTSASLSCWLTVVRLQLMRRRTVCRRENDPSCLFVNVSSSPYSSSPQVFGIVCPRWSASCPFMEAMTEALLVISLRLQNQQENI